MATADYLSSANLNDVARGGVVREDVLSKIWEIDNIPLPFTDMIGTGSHSNSYTSWVQDALQAQNLSNAAVDGQDVGTYVNHAPAPRVGNHSQISTKAVAVSERAQSVDQIGGNALSYQLSQRQKELKRDIEGIMLTGQASVADDGDTTAGKSGGLASWLTTNISLGATGTAGGYSTSTGLTVAPAPGTKRAGSEAVLRDLLQGVYTQGGNPTTLMSVPAVIRKFSEYLFTSTAKVATLTGDVSQSRSKGKGDAARATGAVNVFVSDFGITVNLEANRLQPVESAGQATMFILDPSLLELSYLKGVHVSPLAKDGLADKRLMSADWTLKVLNEKGLGAYFAIDTALAFTA